LLQRAARILSEERRPFLRWAGSKRRLLSQIVPHLPESFNRYFEPFLGGGALFFLLGPERALLSDSNAELIQVWRAVAEAPSEVHKWSVALPLTSENYYEVRSRRSIEPLRRAGEFIYLNRGAFNGLYRVNRSGAFNVPWGAPRSLNVIDEASLTGAAKSLSSARVKVEVLDFQISVDRSTRGDLVYLDPPYVTGHNNNGFVDYNEKLFSWADQIRLAQAAESARMRGAHVIVSNAYHPEVAKLYPNFTVQALTRKSNIAGNAKKRGEAVEALFVGRPRG